MINIHEDPSLGEDLRSWYLSWSTNGTSLGAAIITVNRPKNTYIHAIRAAIALGIEPGGNVDGWPIMREIDSAFTDRLLTPDEASTIGEYVAAESRGLSG